MEGLQYIGMKIRRQEKPLLRWVVTCALFLFSAGVPVHAGLIKPDVDYSNYQTP